jgi:hypothetical protein
MLLPVNSAVAAELTIELPTKERRPPTEAFKTVGWLLIRDSVVGVKAMHLYLAPRG